MLSLRKKICAVVAGCLGLSFAGFTIATIATVVTGTAPEKAEEDTTAYEFDFTGNITLNDVAYDVTLKGVDKKFSISANKISDVINGTYAFTENQGWTLKFNDTSSSIIRTQYNDTSKSFEFIYHLDLGSRGEGNLRFTYEDKDFKPAAERWSDIPSFKGVAGFFGGSLNYDIMISCDDAGNFNTVADSAIRAVTGTYEFKDEQYVFTTADATYTTTKNEDGLYTFVFPVHNSLLEAYGAADTTATMIQQVLTVD